MLSQELLHTWLSKGYKCYYNWQTWMLTFWTELQQARLTVDSIEETYLGVTIHHTWNLFFYVRGQIWNDLCNHPVESWRKRRKEYWLHGCVLCDEYAQIGQIIKLKEHIWRLSLFLLPTIFKIWVQNWAKLFLCHLIKSEY